MTRDAFPFGDDAVAVACAVGEARAIAAALAIPGVLEVVPGYERVVAHLEHPSHRDAVLAHARRLSVGGAFDAGAVRTHVIRAIYDGPDLVEIAETLGLSPRQVAERHAGSSFVAELVGFLPGFAYLGGLDPTLALPRRPSPRPRVAAGTVAIAGPRSGIYPLTSPGGWNLVGRVVGFSAFDPARDPPAAIAVGDRVQFVIEDVP